VATTATVTTTAVTAQSVQHCRVSRASIGRGPPRRRGVCVSVGGAVMDDRVQYWERPGLRPHPAVPSVIPTPQQIFEWVQVGHADLQAVCTDCWSEHGESELVGVSAYRLRRPGRGISRGGTARTLCPSESRFRHWVPKRRSAGHGWACARTRGPSPTGSVWPRLSWSVLARRRKDGHRDRRRCRGAS
jgi:hypothetical protein